VVRKVRIPKGYYFGLSAATGDLADNHDVISFKVIDPQQVLSFPQILPVL
jgi:mannose-binding lectin 2